MKRNYIIPLRKAYVNKPKYKKTPTAIRAVKAFLMKHMKVEEVRIGKNLNMVIWANGVKNPPAKVSVEVEKKDNVAYAELSGKPYDEPTKEDLEAAKEAKEKKRKKEANEGKAKEGKAKEGKAKEGGAKEEAISETDGNPELEKKKEAPIKEVKNKKSEKIQF